MDDTSDILHQEIKELEKELTEKIEKISIGTLVGKWVSEHVGAVGIGSVVTLVTFIGSIVMSVYWVNEHYVEAAEFQKDMANISKQSDLRNLEMRRWLLEQRLEDMSTKTNPTPEEQKRTEKIKADLEKIDNQIQELQSGNR